MFVKYLIKTTFYWLLLFAFYRLLFILFNIKYADDTAFTYLLASFGAGLRIDVAMTGYAVILVCLSQTVSLLTVKKFTSTAAHLINYLFTVLFSLLLLVNILLYNYWGKHLDAEALSYLATPWFIITSMRWYEPVFFLLVAALLIWAALKFYRLLARGWFSKNILADQCRQFAFFVYPDAFGMITPSLFYVFDNSANRFIHFEENATPADSIEGKAYLQILSLDHQKRGEWRSP